MNMKEAISKLPIGIGSFIKVDSWELQGLSLIEGNSYSDDSFPGCSFRLPSGRYEDINYAVNITITGRTIQWKQSNAWVRVKIEFVGDGEPSTFENGYLLLTKEQEEEIYSQLWGA